MLAHRLVFGITKTTHPNNPKYVPHQTGRILLPLSTTPPPHALLLIYPDFAFFIFSLKQAEKIPAHVVHPEPAGVIESLDRLLVPRAPRPVAHKPQPQGKREVHSDATATATATATVGRHRRISIRTSVRRKYGHIPVVVCVEGGRWWLNSSRREGPRARARGLHGIWRLCPPRTCTSPRGGPGTILVSILALTRLLNSRIIK